MLLRCSAAKETRSCILDPGDHLHVSVSVLRHFSVQASAAVDLYLSEGVAFRLIHQETLCAHGYCGATCSAGYPLADMYCVKKRCG